MLIKSSCILLFAWALCGVVLSQDIKFDRLTERDGLSHSGIISITQDQQGYMWVGTRNGGLHKYDGYTFTVYQHDPEDVTSISSNWIESLFVDHAGVLWVGTNGKGGLNRYDSHTDSFVRYYHEPDNVNSLIDDRIQVVYEAPSEPGILWVGTELGLVRFNTMTGEMISYTNNPEDDKSLSYNHVRAIYEDQRGTLWIGTGGYALEHEGKGGLNRFDRESGGFQRFLHDPSDEHSLIDNRVDVIYEDSKDTFWVGTRGDGLHQFDVLNEKFKRFSFESNPDALPTKPHLLIRKEDPYEGVSFIREDRWGQLWIGGWKGGLNQYDLVSETQIHYERDPQDPSSLIDNNVLCAYEDRQGTLWVGTWSGLHKVVRKRLHFNVYEHDPIDQNSLSTGNILSLAQDQKGRIWIPMYSGGVGVEMLDPITGTFTHFRRNTHGLSSDTVRAVFQDHEGAMWLGTEGGGLNLYDELTDSFIHYMHNPSDESSIVNDTVLVITEGAPGMLWIGTRQGLSRFDVNRNTFYNYPVDLSEAYRPGNKSVTEIHVDRTGYIWFATESGGVHKIDPSLDTITEHQFNDRASRIGLSEFQTEIYEDKAGAIWVGRRLILNSERAEFLHLSPENSPSNGLYRYESTNNSFISILPETSIRVIYEGHDGSLWLATHNGLYSIKHKTGKINHYTTTHGLVSNEVYSILEDDLGILWIGTESGMSRFDPGLGSFSSFYREDGIPKRIFRQNGGLVGMDGMLYFGLVDNSEGALISFNPLETSINNIPPQLVFTGLSVSNSLIQPGPKAPIKEPITIAKQIILGAQEQSFSLEFSALHFQMPQENTYQYILKGYEEDWVDSGTIRLARYSQVTPGTYTFMVKAANSEGVWSDEFNSIDVVILPHWYQTWWAYLLFGFFFCACLFSLYRFQRNRLIVQERIKAQQEKAKAIESANNELQRALKHLTETQDQLIHTEKMASLGQLTAGVAHEIKNPLNFVNNFATIAKGQIEEIEETILIEEKNFKQVRFVELKEVIDDLKVNAIKINEHGRRADSIIRSMLEHSRTGRGEKRSIDLNKLIEEYINLAYHGIRARVNGFVVELDKELDPEVGKLDLYPQEVGRVLINLFDNAFYTVNEKRLSIPERYTSRVSVHSRKNGNLAEVRVMDNGMGIPAHLQEKVFEPFFTTKPTGNGTGLGLSLSHDIVVKGHRGELLLESEEGRGSDFIIRLPY